MRESFTPISETRRGDANDSEWQETGDGVGDGVLRGTHSLLPALHFPTEEIIAGTIPIGAVSFARHLGWTKVMRICP